MGFLKGPETNVDAVQKREVSNLSEAKRLAKVAVTKPKVAEELRERVNIEVDLEGSQESGVRSQRRSSVWEKLGEMLRTLLGKDKEVRSQESGVREANSQKPIAKSEMLRDIETSEALVAEQRAHLVEFMGERYGKSLSDEDFENHFAGVGIDQEGMGSCFGDWIDLRVFSPSLHQSFLQTHCEKDGEAFTFYFPVTAPREKGTKVTVTPEEYQGEVVIEGQSYRLSTAEKQGPIAFQVALLKHLQDGTLDWGRVHKEGGHPYEVMEGLLGESQGYAEADYFMCQDQKEAITSFFKEAEPGEYLLSAVSSLSASGEGDSSSFEIDGVRFSHGHAFRIEGFDSESRTLTLSDPRYINETEAVDPAFAPWKQKTVTVAYSDFFEHFDSVQHGKLHYGRILAGQT